MKRALLLSLLLVGGCISLLPKPPPPPRMFVLEAGPVEPLAAQTPIDAVISVALPAGERAIMGADLIWRRGDEVAYVAQTQWSSRAEFALQAMLVETLSRQGRFNAATRSGEGRSDYEIRWDVLDFEVTEDSMRARFVADVRVLTSPGRRVVAQEIISAEAPVADRASSAAASALTRAAREASARIGVFAAEAAARAEADAADAQASAASINR